MLTLLNVQCYCCDTAKLNRYRQHFGVLHWVILELVVR